MNTFAERLEVMAKGNTDSEVLKWIQETTARMIELENRINVLERDINALQQEKVNQHDIREAIRKHQIYCHD